MHLGDYKTKRNEIEVFCTEHIPSTNVRVFTLVAETSQGFTKGYSIGVRYLTDNARQNARQNFLAIQFDAVAI